MTSPESLPTPWSQVRLAAPEPVDCCAEDVLRGTLPRIDVAVPEPREDRPLPAPA